MKSNIGNIMRSQMYQLVRNRSLRAVLLGVIAVSVFFGAADHIAGGTKNNTYDNIVLMLSMIVNLSMFTIAIVTGIVCADDFTDKTANYELTSGRLRSESYAARAIVSVIISVLSALLMVFALIITSFVLYPRGCSLTNAALAQRVLLLIPVYIRISCFYVFLSYIFKRPIAVVGICYAMITVLSIMMGMGGEGETAVEGSVLTGMGSFKMICSFNEWYAYGLNTSTYHVYEPYVESGTAVQLVAVSLAAGALYLLLGYSFFHRDDIQ